MSDRITTLLELVRLETGAIQPRVDLYGLEELVGSVLHRLEQRLRRHRVTIELPDSLPLLAIDGKRLVVTGESRQIFDILVTSNPNGVWESLVTLTNQTGVVEFTDADAGSTTQRFYRIRVR